MATPAVRDGMHTIIEDDGRWTVGIWRDGRLAMMVNPLRLAELMDCGIEELARRLEVRLLPKGAT